MNSCDKCNNEIGMHSANISPSGNEVELRCLECGNICHDDISDTNLGTYFSLVKSEKSKLQSFDDNKGEILSTEIMNHVNTCKNENCHVHDLAFEIARKYGP